jgi:hypothetical protein
MNSKLNALVLFFAFSFASGAWAQNTVSCAANCGSATGYHEVVSTGQTIAAAFASLVSSCNQSLFLQSTQRSDGQFDYTLATIQNACLNQAQARSCACSANCGSAQSYEEVVGTGELAGQAFSELINQCRTSILFTQATLRTDGEFDYTLASLQDACTCN